MAGEKYLIFEVCNRKFSLEFADIKIITAGEKPQPIPDFPEYVLGTIVNEEQIVPVIDLRRRFHYEVKELTDRDCIIITNGERPVGLIADFIDGFCEVESEKIQPAPNLNSDASARFIKGEFLDGDSPCYVLDGEKVIKAEDSGLFEVIENSGT